MRLNESCGATAPLNTGKKNQCVMKPAFTFILVRSTFSFDSVADARNKEKWDEAKRNKDIVPFYRIDGVEDATKERKTYEGRNDDWDIVGAVDGVKYNQILGDCSYEALKSYHQNGEYQSVFIISTDGNFQSVINEDGTVSGLPLASFRVGNLVRTTDEKPSNVDVTLRYEEHSRSSIKPDFLIKAYDGIVDLGINTVSVSDTEVKLSVGYGCSAHNLLDNLVADNFVVKDTDGTVVEPTFTSADADGVYTLTGTFESGFTVEVVDEDGESVIVQPEDMFEAVSALTLAVA